MHQSILIYRRYLFLKLGVAAALATIVAYLAHAPLGPPNGGTWLGYALGTVSAALVVWLTWYGVRRRRYGPGRSNLEAWLSAHIYLGLALIVTATLHTGFQFGLNVHTLAYALMLAVIVSGIVGVFLYLRIPEAMTRNRRGKSQAEILLQIAEIGEECQRTAMGLSEEVNTAVFEAMHRIRVGGGLSRQLSGRDPRCPIAALSARLEALATAAGGEQADDFRRLVAAVSRQRVLLRQVRLDLRYQVLMQVWLFVHLPLSLALLAALTAHVLSVFVYW